ncbi:MAG TPA: fumarylacetoacetate hydrolase family protein, partial [Pseudomonadales bacterium]|nr:fumarylacetoacetate hydrolase family protein [Pseudomonadales bacterium]
MKLATLRDGTRDGRLAVVSRDLAAAAWADGIARTLQQALDDWPSTAPRLAALAAALDKGSAQGVFAFDPEAALAPLPRGHHWVDGSAYVNHVELVRKARGAEMPESFWTDPLVYQGGSDDFLGPAQDAPFASEDWGIDLEAEVAVVTDDVPMSTDALVARQHIKLVMLVNDWSLRNLIPGELAKGFGFYQSKPATAFSPVAVTPDELGEAWDGAKLHLPIIVHLNDRLLGRPNAGVDMTFDFGQLIAHATKTRRLGAGAIVGSGTISNLDRSLGSCCLAELRMLETLARGTPATPFMKFGDRVRIEMLDPGGRSI